VTNPNQQRGNVLYRPLKLIQHGGRRIFQLAEGSANMVFGPKGNPLYFLGGLSFFFFYVLLVSGVYVYLFYSAQVNSAYASVEHLTHEQWYLGGVMRSLHRYAADAMVVTMILHMLRRFFNDRYNGARSFSWITGVPMLWMVSIAGILGYWLVWDKMAQFSIVRTFEWIDWLPVIAEPTARNFLTQTSMTNTLFRLLLITHMGVALFMLAAMLIHTNRLNRPKINPPRRIIIGTLAALLLLSLASPALSHGPADLGKAVGILHLDWFYMSVYPVLALLPGWMSWSLLGGGTVFLMLLPWLPSKRREPAAAVDLAQCSGCNLCVVDCPYEAIRLEPRTDGHPRFTREAQVVESKCVSCGICTGSCPFSTPFRRTQQLKSAIEMPGSGMQQLRDATDEALRQLTGDQRIIIFGCDYGMDISVLNHANTVGISLECIGMLPPSLIDYALRQGADGVFITGCRMGDCFHRLGNQWMQQRLNDERMPELHRKVPRDRVGFFLAAEADQASLHRELNAFRHALPVPDKAKISTDGKREVATDE